MTTGKEGGAEPMDPAAPHRVPSSGRLQDHIPAADVKKPARAKESRAGEGRGGGVLEAPRKGGKGVLSEARSRKKQLTARRPTHERAEVLLENKIIFRIEDERMSVVYQAVVY